MRSRYGVLQYRTGVSGRLAAPALRDFAIPKRCFFAMFQAMKKAPKRPRRPKHISKLQKIAVDPKAKPEHQIRAAKVIEEHDKAQGIADRRRESREPKPVQLDVERFKDLEAHLAALGPAKGKTQGPNAWYFLGQEPHWEELINAGFSRQEVVDHSARQGYDATLILP